MRRLLSASLFTTALLVATLAIAGPGNGNGNGNGNGGNNGGGVTAEAFDIVYCWGTSTWDPACPVIENTLYSDGTIHNTWISFPPYVDEAADEWGTWSTKRRGTRMTITWDGGAEYSGVLQNDGCYTGSMTAPNGLAGVWRGC